MSRGDPDVLHAVYSALLEKCPFSVTVAVILEKRGLTQEQIKQREYKAIPAFRERPQIAENLSRKFSGKLQTVPGFIRRREKRTLLDNLRPDSGIFIPCRDVQGRIVAL